MKFEIGLNHTEKDLSKEHHLINLLVLTKFFRLFVNNQNHCELGIQSNTW